MSSSFDNRQELLLEHMKDLTQKKYANLNDGNILTSIFNYLRLFNTFKEYKKNEKPMNVEDIIELNRLHNLIYGADFDENDIFKTGSSSALIIDLFKSKYSAIKKIMNDTDNTSSEILKDLIPLLTVFYYKNKDRKKIINDYLNQIIIPAISGNKLTTFSKDISNLTSESTKVSNIIDTVTVKASPPPVDNDRNQSRIAKKQKKNDDKEEQLKKDRQLAIDKLNKDKENKEEEQRQKAKTNLISVELKKKQKELDDLKLQQTNEKKEKIKDTEIAAVDSFKTRINEKSIKTEEKQIDTVFKTEADKTLVTIDTKSETKQEPKKYIILASIFLSSLTDYTFKQNIKNFLISVNEYNSNTTDDLKKNIYANLSQLLNDSRFIDNSSIIPLGNTQDPNFIKIVDKYKNAIFLLLQEYIKSNISSINTDFTYISTANSDNITTLKDYYNKYYFDLLQLYNLSIIDIKDFKINYIEDSTNTIFNYYQYIFNIYIIIYYFIDENVITNTDVTNFKYDSIPEYLIKDICIINIKYYIYNKYLINDINIYYQTIYLFYICNFINKINDSTYTIKNYNDFKINLLLQTIDKDIISDDAIIENICQLIIHYISKEFNITIFNTIISNIISIINTYINTNLFHDRNKSMLVNKKKKELYDLLKKKVDLFKINSDSFFLTASKIFKLINEKPENTEEIKKLYDEKITKEIKKIDPEYTLNKDDDVEKQLLDYILQYKINNLLLLLNQTISYNLYCLYNIDILQNFNEEFIKQIYDNLIKYLNILYEKDNEGEPYQNLSNINYDYNNTVNTFLKELYNIVSNISVTYSYIDDDMFNNFYNLIKCHLIFIYNKNQENDENSEIIIKFLNLILFKFYLVDNESVELYNLINLLFTDDKFIKLYSSTDLFAYCIKYELKFLIHKKISIKFDQDFEDLKRWYLNYITKNDTINEQDIKIDTIFQNKSIDKDIYIKLIVLYFETVIKYIKILGKQLLNKSSDRKSKYLILNKLKKDSNKVFQDIDDYEIKNIVVDNITYINETIKSNENISGGGLDFQNVSKKIKSKLPKYGLNKRTSSFKTILNKKTSKESEESEESDTVARRPRPPPPWSQPPGARRPQQLPQRRLAPSEAPSEAPPGSSSEEEAEAATRVTAARRPRPPPPWSQPPGARRPQQLPQRRLAPSEAPSEAPPGSSSEEEAEAATRVTAARRPRPPPPSLPASGSPPGSSSSSSSSQSPSPVQRREEDSLVDVSESDADAEAETEALIDIAKKYRLKALAYRNAPADAYREAAEAYREVVTPTSLSPAPRRRTAAIQRLRQPTPPTPGSGQSTSEAAEEEGEEAAEAFRVEGNAERAIAYREVAKAYREAEDAYLVEAEAFRVEGNAERAAKAYREAAEAATVAEAAEAEAAEAEAAEAEAEAEAEAAAAAEAAEAEAAEAEAEAEAEAAAAAEAFRVEGNAERAIAYREVAESVAESVESVAESAESKSEDENILNTVPEKLSEFIPYKSNKLKEQINDLEIDINILKFEKKLIDKDDINNINKYYKKELEKCTDIKIEEDFKKIAATGGGLAEDTICKLHIDLKNTFKDLKYLQIDLFNRILFYYIQLNINIDQYTLAAINKKEAYSLLITNKEQEELFQKIKAFYSSLYQINNNIKQIININYSIKIIKNENLNELLKENIRDYNKKFNELFDLINKNKNNITTELITKVIFNLDENITDTNFNVISFNYTDEGKDKYLKKIYDKSGNFFIVHFLYLFYLIKDNEKNIHELHKNIINDLLDNFKKEYTKILIHGYIYNNFIDTIIQTKLKKECKKNNQSGGFDLEIQKGGALVPKYIKNIIKILCEYNDKLNYKYDDQSHYKLDDLNELLKLIIKKIKYNSTNRLLYSDKSIILLPTIFKLNKKNLEQGIEIDDYDYSKYWMLDKDIKYGLKINIEEIEKRYNIFTNILDTDLKQCILYLFEYKINELEYPNDSSFLDIIKLYNLQIDTNTDTLESIFRKINELLVLLKTFSSTDTSVQNTFKIDVIEKLEIYTTDFIENYTESLKDQGDERLVKTSSLNIENLDFSYPSLIKYKKTEKENIPTINITALNIKKYLTHIFQIDNDKIQELLLVFYYYQKYDTSVLIDLKTDKKLILERLVDYIYTKLTNPNITYLVNYSIDELLILLYITLEIQIIIINNNVNFKIIYYENKENIKIDIFYNSLYNILKNNINLYKLVNYIFNNIINNCYKLYLSNIILFDKYINEYLKPILEIIKVTNNNNLRLIISFENYLHLLILSNYNSNLKQLLEVKDNINLKIKDLLSLLNIFYIYNGYNNGDIKTLEDKLILLLNDNDLINKYKIIKNTNLKIYDNIAGNIAVIKDNKSNFINILLYNHNEIESYDKSLIDSNKPTIVSVIPIKQEYNEFLTIFKTKQVCTTHYDFLKSLNDTDLQTIDDIIILANIDKNIGFCNPCNVCYRNAVFTFIKYIPYIIEQLKDVKEITDFLTYPDYNNTVKFYNLLFKLAAEDNTLISMLKKTTQEDIIEFLDKILKLFIYRYKIDINKLEHKTSIDKLNKLYYNINYSLFIGNNNELDFSKIVFNYEVNIINESEFDVINNTFNDYIILSIQVSEISLIGKIIFTNYTEITINNNKYILNSFICRIGNTTTNGHYYNMVKDDKSKKWYKIDDSNNIEVISDLTEHIKYVYVLYYKKSDTPSNIFDHIDNSYITNFLHEFSINNNITIDNEKNYVQIHDDNVKILIKKIIEKYNNDIKYSKLYNYIKSYCEILLLFEYNNNIIIEDLKTYISNYYSSYTNILYNITINDRYFEYIIQNINNILNLSIDVNIISNSRNNIDKIIINDIYNELILLITPNYINDDNAIKFKNIILYHFIYLLKLLYIPEIDNINIISGNYIHDNVINNAISNKCIDILCIFNDIHNNYHNDYYDKIVNDDIKIYSNLFSNWSIKDIKYISYDATIINILKKNAILFKLYNKYDNTKIIKILVHDFFGNNDEDILFIKNNFISNYIKIKQVKINILKQIIDDNNNNLYIPDIIIGSFNSDYEYYINIANSINDTINPNIIKFYESLNIDLSTQYNKQKYTEINNFLFIYLNSKYNFKALCDNSTICFDNEYKTKHTTSNETSEDVIYINPHIFEDGNQFEILNFIRQHSVSYNFLSTTLKLKNQQLSQVSGGKNKNDISLSEVFKYYYNNKTEEFNNIYKLYFILNIYSYYNNKIFDIKKNLRDIYNETKEIYRKYIEDFNKNSNCFIKNYYINREELEDYLNFNFIYHIYENIEKEPINIKIKINNSKIKIKKTSKEIEEEIEEFIKNKDYKIFNNSIEFKMKYQNKSYREDISYFINFIKYYTYYQKRNEVIKINNINDLLSLIVLEFISNSRKIIKLNINDNNYTIQNIKVHPYKTYNNYNGKVLITLSEIEETLFLRLLRTPRNRGLYALLAHDYYYLDFDLRKPSEYYYYINEEIEEIINDIKFEPEKREIINLNFYHFMPLETIKNLRIINDNTKLKFIINYGILLISTLYTSITLYNFISLIYIYLALNKYKKDLEEYNFNIIELLRTVIIAFKIKLKKEIDINSFILKIVNFKDNPFINNLKINIKIDINILIKLLKNKKDNDEINYEDLYKSLKYIIDNYIITKYDEIVIKLQYSFILPILKELILRTDINTISIQEEIVKIKAYELLLKIDKYKEIKGGDTISDITDVITQRGTTDIQKKTTTKESDEIKKSTDTTPNINKMIKDIEIIGKIEQLINTLDINSLEDKYYNKLKEFTFIPTVKKDNTKSEIFVFDTATILGNLKLNFDDPNFLTDLNKISTLIETNLKNIQDEIKLYSEESQKTKGSPEQQLITKIKEEINKLKGIIESLAEYKEINNGDVKQLLKDFKIIIDEKEYVNLIGNPKSIVDDFEEYIIQIENIINTYRNILKDINNTYESIKKGLEEIKSAYKEKLRNPTTNDRNLQRRLRIQEKEDEEDEEKEMKKGGGKLDEFEAKIKTTDAGKKPISFDELKNLFKKEDKEKFKNIKDKINEIKTHYKKLKTSNLVSDSIDKEEVLNNFVDKNGVNLFEKMLYQYDTDLKDSTEEIAKNNFYNNLENNDLDPEKQLAVTIYDKLIFVIVIIVLRLLVLQVVYYFIDIGTVVNIKKAIYYYAVAYTIIFFITVFVVNVDVFRLRIVFNYINMHVNSTSIFGHLLINIIISYLIYLLILNLNSDPARTNLSKNEKIKLKTKVDVLSITIVIFMIIITLVI